MPPEATGPTPTKITVKLTPKSVDALERASRAGGLNHTDTINRAVQLYDFIVDILDENQDNALLVMRNGKPERIHLR